MEVNLDLSLVHVPITMSELLGDVSKTKEKSQKISKLNDYIKKLTEEKRKIDAFKRELPLIMFLVKNAIGKLKKEVIQCTGVQEQTEIEEFMAAKGNREEGGGVVRISDLSEKGEWMSSAQLWSSDINFDHQKPDSLSEPKLRRQEDNYRSRDGISVPFKERIGLAITEEKEFSHVSDLSLMNPAMKLDSRRSKRMASNRSRLPNHKISNTGSSSRSNGGSLGNKEGAGRLSFTASL